MRRHLLRKALPRFPPFSSVGCRKVLEVRYPHYNKPLSVVFVVKDSYHMVCYSSVSKPACRILARFRVNRIPKLKSSLEKPPSNLLLVYSFFGLFIRLYLMFFHKQKIWWVCRRRDESKTISWKALPTQVDDAEIENQSQNTNYRRDYHIADNQADKERN